MRERYKDLVRKLADNDDKKHRICMNFKFLILTNYHVVKEAADKKPLEDFRLDGKRTFEISTGEQSSIGGKSCNLQARIIEVDEKHDLALLTLVYTMDDAGAVQDFAG